MRERLRIRRARLPWSELEAEAKRQGCSAADILFDRAGRVAAVEQTPEGPRIALHEARTAGNHRRATSTS